MGVFTSLLSTPIDRLNLGARAHAILAAEGWTGFAHCLARDNWRCQICGVRLPGYMEVEHVASHHDHAVSNLRCICQFCHNLRHPLWAANRGKFRPFWSSGTDQRLIHAIAWSVLMAGSFPEKMAEIHRAVEQFLMAIKRREMQLLSLLGSTHPEGMFESVFFTTRQYGPDYGRTVARQMDRHVRFWPTAANRSLGGTKRDAAQLSAWDGDGFQDRSGDLLDDMRAGTNDLDGLRRACQQAAVLGRQCRRHWN